MTILAQTHIVAFPVQAWGHCRPLITLAARFVKLRPVHVTFLTTNHYYDKVKAELARNFHAGEEIYASRLRVIAIGDWQPDACNESFKAFWVRLAAAEGVKCAKTAIIHNALPKPQAAIIDSFAVAPVATIRKISGSTVKIYGWYPASTLAMFYLLGPEKLGGMGDVHAKAEVKAKRTGRSYEEVVFEMLYVPKGEVIRVPGLPPMYDHEYYPQDFPVPADIGIGIVPRIYQTLKSCDGLLLFTAESYEPEAVAASKLWLAETGRSAYTCGPLLPPTGSQAVIHEKKQSKQGAEIQDFLEATLKTSGEKSLLYISLGSHFWPVKSPEKLWAFLDVVIEHNIPFILSHAPYTDHIPGQVKEKVKAYGKGLLSAWSPQQTILEHPVTGWYVTHGGHNGVTEAIHAAVPMILWPFVGDQPLNAIHLTNTLQVAYELIEVRTGYGLKEIYRNGRRPIGSLDAVKEEAHDVLAKAFGKDGARKREKMKALTRALNHEWEEGGTSLRDVTAFLDSL
ncbi:UDP-Glycosyltransferase/glycogen phosphorylase [Cubamyces sp. BRFM 1775]|nr:UDP-Glycosyltransferase/glycogen phosphorylase [Cubamyces sp. BRFM 1775]